MRHVRYCYDHKKGSEGYANALVKKENYEFPFFLESIADWKQGSKYYTRREKKDNYYILYTVSGTGIVEYRGKRVVLKPGELCFIYCMEPHFYATYECTVWNSIWMHVEGPGVKNYFDLINGTDDFHIIRTDSTDYIRTVYRRVVPYIMKRDAVSESKINLILTEFLDFVLEKFYETRVLSTDNAPAWIKQLPGYLHSRLQENLSITQIAQDMGVTPYQVETIFKKYWDTDLATYIREMREDQSRKDNANIKCQNPEWVNTATRYIDEHYDKKINLAALAESLHVSQPVFYRNFKCYTCMSPSDYLLRIRLTKALFLIENTDSSIVDIAYNCGFPSPSFFSKKFNAYMGTTPKKYRLCQGNFSS